MYGQQQQNQSSIYGGGSSGGNPASDQARKERAYTPKGTMSAGRDAKPSISDLMPHMKLMFEPNPPIEWKPMIEKREKINTYNGISIHVSEFEKEKPVPIQIVIEDPNERRKRIREAKNKINDEKTAILASAWDPHNDSKASSNAYHTLFVAKLSYDTTEKKLKREFEEFGQIEFIRIVTDRDGKSRGYGFIQFEKETDMTAAYKRMDGKKIDGRRITVDVERGRTVKNWKPRKFGGGLGGRLPKKSKAEIKEEVEELKKKAGPYGPLPTLPPSIREDDRKRDDDRGRFDDRRRDDDYDRRRNDDRRRDDDYDRRRNDDRRRDDDYDRRRRDDRDRRSRSRDRRRY